MTAVAMLLCAGASVTASDFLMEGVDAGRTGWVKDEKVFTTANVGSSTLLWKLKLESTPRAMHNLFAPLIDFAALGMTRRAFIEAMHAKGIGVGVHYQAMHLFAAYRKLGYQEGDFPNAETIGARTVTLPLFSKMEEADADRVCRALQEVILNR